MVPEQVLDYVKNLSLGDHVVFFYETLNIKHQVLFSLLKDRLEKGESIGYRVDAKKIPEVRQAMKDFGIQVSRFEREGLLEIAGFDTEFARTGAPTKAPERLNDTYKSRGMTIMISDNPLTVSEPSRLIELERTHGKKMKVPVIMLCAYNTKQIVPVNGDFFETLLEAHGHAIFQGIAFKLE